MRLAPKDLPALLRTALLVGLVAAVVWLALAWRRAVEQVRTPRLGPPVANCPANAYPRLDRPIHFKIDFYGMEYEGRSDNWIDANILYLGAFEKPELYFMRDLMHVLNKGQGIFVDVGANTGQHSLFMSKHAAQVHAFEPFEEVLRRFRAMVQKNKIDNIIIHSVGLGEKEARLPFYKPPAANLGTGSFIEGYNPANRPLKELQIVVGDRALAAAGVSHVDLIKIDVEGYEGPVLRGLKRTLAASRPVVVMEITLDPKSKVAFQSEQQLMEAFPARYQLLAFDSRSDAESGRYLLTRFELNFGRKGKQNIVLVPAEKSRRIPREGPVAATSQSSP